MRIIGNRILGRTSAILAASSFEERNLRATIGDHHNIVVSGLGVEIVDQVDDFNEDRYRQRRVLFLSRLAPKKRLELLIDACALHCGTEDEFEVVVAGSGDAQFALALEQRSQGLPVSFVGHISGQERSSLENNCALFVLPSANENFGQAITEAMAAGLPVVTTDQTGAASHVSSAGSGWVLDRIDPETLGEVIVTALSDPADLKRRAEQGTAYVREKLSWQRVADTWIEAAGRKA